MDRALLRIGISSLAAEVFIFKLIAKQRATDVNLLATNDNLKTSTT